MLDTHNNLYIYTHTDLSSLSNELLQSLYLPVQVGFKIELLSLLSLNRADCTELFLRIEIYKNNSRTCTMKLHPFMTSCLNNLHVYFLM